MSIHRKTFRTFSTLILITALAVTAFADTVKLKDGSIIKGRIVSFSEGRFTVLIGSGSRQRQMVIFADEVESVEFDGIGPSVARSNAPSYNDASISRAGSGRNSAGVSANPGPGPSTDTSTAPRSVAPEPGNQSTPSPQPVTKGVVINLKVTADASNNGWTNSGLVVRKGQRIRITGAGQVTLGPGRSSTPSGLAGIEDKDKLMPNEATGLLIAVIGDDNNDFIAVGPMKEFIAARDGVLFLGLNEGKLDDNVGSFDVSIEVDPR